MPTRAATAALDESVLAELAAAVAARDWGFPLDAANRSGRGAPLESLTGTVFAVRPKDDILVIDYDLAGDGPADTVKQAAFDQLAGALSCAGVPAVVVASGRPGHRHLFARVGADSRRRGALDRWCRAGGLDVRSHGVRPPLSPHRLGLPVALLQPASATEAVTVLTHSPPAGALEAVCAALGAPVLSSRMWRLLSDGHQAVGYESASHGRMALAVAAQEAGYSPDWLAGALTDPANALGDTFRSRPARWQSREIGRLWAKAQSWRDSHQRPAPFTSRTDALEALKLWAHSLQQCAWPSMAGGTDLAVAEAMASLAHRAGGPVFAASLPQVALAAGVSVCTARRALRRLAARGLVAVAEKPTPARATRWKLCLAPSPGAAPSGVGFPSGELGEDLARWAGIGKSAARVLRELSDCPLGLADLAARLHTSTNAVRLLLRRLSRLGLAGRHPSGWVLGDADPAAVASELGVAGAGAADAAAYEAQRAQRAAVRARWSAARSEAIAAAGCGDRDRFAACARHLPARALSLLWRQFWRDPPELLSGRILGD